jgi:diadenylate cyclase
MSNLFPLLLDVRWQDVVDITLNSYILFRLYALFRGTNVLRILIAILFLLFFQRIAAYLGLIVTSWALQAITAVGALIIIVVFRNEIRSVLQARNLKSILWGFPHRRGQIPLEIVAESVFELARKRSGALVVFPGGEDLEDALQGGISWGGWVSREMIVSIFCHDNPVHDGAAIIEGDRVSQVGAILPLSRREDLPSKYGTRHRAAAGLAETTDALVIVVSEESGQVVVAKGSKMSNVTCKEDLEEILQIHLDIPQRQWEYPRRQKLEFGTAALISIMCITGVWFSFTKGLDALITLETPIEYMNRDPGKEIVDTSVGAVRLGLSGSGSLIKSIRPGQIQVKIDLSKAVVGRNTFTITPESITLPPGIILKSVKPSVVEVSLDVPIEKSLAIQVDWTGKLSKGLMLANATLDPARVVVIGGKRILEKTSTVYTEKVSLDNLEKSGTITAKLALSPALKLTPGSKDKVTIAYVLRKRL